MKNFKEVETISTKDLYLLEFMEVVSKEYIYRGVEYAERSTEVYVLGRKQEGFGERYEDVFTHTIYEGTYREINPGRKRVRVISPIISSEDKITYEEAKAMLEAHNFFCIKQSYQDNTKKLMEFFLDFNKLINVNPDEAEKLAKQIMNTINTLEQNKQGVKQDGKPKVLVKKDSDQLSFISKLIY